MKEGYRLLGDFIRQVDVRNTDGKEENLLGVSVQKMFIPSIANTVGTDFTKYKADFAIVLHFRCSALLRGYELHIVILNELLTQMPITSSCSSIVRTSVNTRKK